MHTRLHRLHIQTEQEQLGLHLSGLILMVMRAILPREGENEQETDQDNDYDYDGEGDNDDDDDVVVEARTMKIMSLRQSWS